MTENQVAGIVCVLVGLFSFFCALKDYDWFMDHRKAKFMAKVLGRNGARYFYMILGGGLATAGVVFFATGLSG